MTEQVYISPGLQTEPLPVTSISFQVNFWQRVFLGEEKSALFGVKGRKAEEENSCSFQKTPPGNPPATGKEDQFAQVYMRGEIQTKEHFPRVQTFRCSGRSFQRAAKRRQGYKSPGPLAEPLQRMKRLCFYCFILFLGIISVYLVSLWFCNNRFSFRQQMDLQALLQLRRGDSLWGDSTLLQVLP